MAFPSCFAKGLAAYLNSTLVDAYFRQFSGHTQVNATDLRSLKYPDLATLNRIGGRIGEPFPNQDELDALIREELSMADDDPVKVKQRIEEAQADTGRPWVAKGTAKRAFRPYVAGVA